MCVEEQLKRTQVTITEHKSCIVYCQDDKRVLEKELNDFQRNLLDIERFSEI
jgi:hypothetical protein